MESFCSKPGCMLSHSDTDKNSMICYCPYFTKNQLGLNELEQLTQGHTGNKWQNWDLIPVLFCFDTKDCEFSQHAIWDSNSYIFLSKCLGNKRIETTNQVATELHLLRGNMPSHFEGSLWWWLMMCWPEKSRIRCGSDEISELESTWKIVCSSSFYL